jgi:predicted DNA-binding protein (UPF0251 family)
MKFCDPRHPRHVEYYKKIVNFRPWGGSLGDMALHSVCPYFNHVKIHRTVSRTVAEFPSGEFVEIRDSKSARCCAHHEKQAEILKVAQYKDAVQTQTLEHSGLDKDPFARAFLAARKINKSL